MASSIPGLLGTGSFPEHFKTESWREALLYLKPNGTAMLTAMSSKMRSRPIKSELHHWLTKVLQAQRGVISSVTQTNGAAYAGGGVAGSQLSVVISTTDAFNQFGVNHLLCLRVGASGEDAPDPDADIVVRVDERDAGTRTLTVTLLEADRAGGGGIKTAANANVALVVGNAHPQGGAFPTALNQKPVEYQNRTQIFRTSYMITGTQEAIEMHGFDTLTEERREKLETHMIEIERAVFSKTPPTRGTSALNGQPEQTMGGLEWFLRDGAPGNVVNFQTDTEFAAKTWAEAGEDFLDKVLEVAFRYGDKEKMCFLGSLANLAVSKIAKNRQGFQTLPTDTTYGISIDRYKTPSGILMLATHPLFVQEPTLRNRMTVVDLPNLELRPLRDTKHKKSDPKESYNGQGIDGRMEEYITELTLEVDHPQNHMIIDGVGLDNPLAA